MENDNVIYDIIYVNAKNVDNFNEDYLKMPQCSEKIILKLMFLLSTWKLKGEISDTPQLTKELLELDERLQIEELLKTEEQKRLYDDFKSFISFNNYVDALSKLKQLLSHLRDLDIRELIRLSKTNDESLAKIKNKNVHLLFGLTGSGKSTTLLFLGGSQMQQIDVNGEIHIAPKPNGVKLKDLYNVRTSYSMKSETRHVTPVMIPLDKESGYSEDSAIFCDLPGLGDTNGAEIDIANGIAIHKCVQLCAGIKPIIFVSNKYGDKFQLLRDLTSILSKMFLNMSNDIEKFEYIYPKFDDSNTVRGKLKITSEDIRQDLENGRLVDKIHHIIIQDMLKKFNPIYVLNPIIDNPNALLLSLANDNFIQNPSRAFQVSFSFDTMNKLENQLEKHLNFIIDSILRLEFELANYKLEELCQINELFANLNVSLTNNLNQTKTRLLSRLRTHCDSLLNMFFKKIDEFYNLDEEDREIYSNCLIFAKYSDKISTIFQDEIADKTKQNKYDKSKTDLHSKSLLLLQFIQQNNFGVEKSNELLGISLNNLQIIFSIAEKSNFHVNDISFVTFLRNLENIYREGCKLIEEKLTHYANNQMSFISIEKSPNQIADNMTKLLNILEKFHEPINNSKSKNDELKEKFLLVLREASNEFQQKRVLNEEECWRLIKIDQYFDQALNNSNLHQHISSNEIRKIYDECFLENVIKYLTSLLSNADDELKLINSNLYKNNLNYDFIQNLFKNLKILRDNNQNFNKMLTENYQVLLDMLSNIVQRIKKDVMEKLLNNDFAKLIQFIKQIDELQWIDNYKANMCKNVKDEIINTIIDHVETLKTSLTSHDISLENSDQLKSIYDNYLIILSYQKLAEKIPELESLIMEANNWLSEKLGHIYMTLNDYFSDIELILPTANLDYEFFEKSIKFIENIKKLRIEEKNINQLFISIKQIIYNRSNLIKIETTNKLKYIQSLDHQISSNPSVSKDIDTICEYMRELDNLQTNYPKCFQIFRLKDFLIWLKESLCDMSYDFDVTLRHLTINDRFLSIKNTISIIKCFKKLDHLIVDTGVKTFSELNRTTDESILTAKKDLYDKCLSCVTMDQVEHLHEYLIKFDRTTKIDTDYLKSIKEKLRFFVQKTFNSQIYEMLSLEELELSKIVQKVRVAQEINVNLRQYFDESSKEIINKFLNKIKSFLCESLDSYLSNTISLNKSYKYSKSDVLIENLLAKHIPYLLQLIDIDSKQIRKNHQNQIRTSIDEYIKSYAINTYPIHEPKKIYTELDKLSDPEFLNYFKKAIIAKWTTELNKITEKSDQQKILKRFVKYLPDNLAEHISFMHEDDNFSKQSSTNGHFNEVLFSEISLKNLRNFFAVILFLGFAYFTGRLMSYFMQK